jgi:hypothetical protein
MNQATKISFTYNMSIEEMLAVSLCNWDFPGVSEIEGFPVTGNRYLLNSGKEVTMPTLHPFGSILNTEDVVKELNLLGLEPANLAELLLYRANTIKQEPGQKIVALDGNNPFLIKGDCCENLIECTDEDNSWDLSRYKSASIWEADIYFAVVPKQCR